MTKTTKKGSIQCTAIIKKRVEIADCMYFCRHRHSWIPYPRRVGKHWQWEHPSPPKRCRRLKWMVPNFVKLKEYISLRLCCVAWLSTLEILELRSFKSLALRVNCNLGISVRSTGCVLSFHTLFCVWKLIMHPVIFFGRQQTANLPKSDDGDVQEIRI